MLLHLQFLEPFRLINWMPREARDPRNPAWLRAQGFARWHCDRGSLKGHPYVTGTLLRSAVIRAVEEELVWGDGRWEGIPCCPGLFHTDNGAPQPKHLRHRQTNSPFRPARAKCEQDQRDQACPFCLLLGRFDRVRAGKKGEKIDPDLLDVRFHNLFPSQGAAWSGPEEIGSQRTLNRVDARTSKAQDVFQVYEVDGIQNFFGAISLADDLPHRAAVESLLRRALGFVSQLCGALCTIREYSDPSIPQALSATSPGQTPFDAAWPELQEVALTKARKVADAVRQVRTLSPTDLKLPPGRLDKNGSQLPHHIWDIPLTNGKTLRDFLEATSRELATSPGIFRQFCQEYGQHLYLQSKGLPRKESTVDLPHALATKEPVFQAVKTRTLHPASYSDDLRNTDVPSVEWIITGTLTARTPFFVGTDMSATTTQTSMPILLTGDFHYRLPRSVLRGCMRRDLSEAVDSQGCRAELGAERPCTCSVCQIMRRVTLLDSVSEVDVPPEIRQRIQRSPHHGIAQDTSLFDAEIGPQGTTFPFVLRLRGAEKSIPPQIATILQWWRQDRLFLGGNVATGKGRFVLGDVQCYQWNLADKRARASYASVCGLRELGRELQNYAGKVPGLAAKEDVAKSLMDSFRKPHPWEKVEWSVRFAGPVLSADPIEALIRSDADAVFFEKTVIGGDQVPQKIPALRGEGVRGLLRSAMARCASGELLAADHSDCQCDLCQVFGNEHHAGLVRCEDLTPTGNATVTTKRIDHVSIDRADQSVVEKFDDVPLVGCPKSPMDFSGVFWVHRNLNEQHRTLLRQALLDLAAGVYPVGGKGGIGYGWITALALPPEWLPAPGTTSSAAPDWAEARCREKRNSLPVPPDMRQQPESENALYYPYYFLPLGPDPKRSTEPTSHATLQADRLTGRIVCSLTTITPLLLPDTERTGPTEDDPKGQGRYPAFRLHDTIMIPGSQIRAAVSQVFEALTSSCFRVMDQRRRLSWRMETADFLGTKSLGYRDKFRPGRLLRDRHNPDRLVVQEMRSYRLPFYDSSVPGNVEGATEYTNAPSYRQDKIDGAQKINSRLVAISKNNRDVLRSIKEKDPERFERIVTGKEPVAFIPKPTNSPHDKLAVLVAGPVPTGTAEGWIKWTGPNNANTQKDAPKSVATCPWTKFDDTWEKDSFSFELGSGWDWLTSNKHTYPRPVLVTVKDDIHYTLTKRCERIFTTETKDPFALPESVRRDHRELTSESVRNTDKLAKPFRSALKKTLQEGDLVYFKVREGAVEQVIPVALFRMRDDRPLGKRLPEPFRPCAHVCLESCEECFAKDCAIPLYREGYPIRGLCPACSLFGTQMHKGRVRFSYAVPTDDTEISTQEVTLPRQERPRLTWVLPKKVRATERTIPGRKFYLRHDGWKQLWSAPGKQEEKSDAITVQAVDSKQKFIFTVHFENLAEEELGLLLYCLRLEENMTHALGRGKHWGFGQVEVSIAEISCRETAGRWCAKTAASGNAEELPILEWQMVQDALQKLSADASPWFEQTHIRALRCLLTRHAGLRARYPELNAESPPGYEQIKKGFAYNPSDSLVVQKTPPILQPWWPLAPGEPLEQKTPARHQDRPDRETVATRPRRQNPVASETNGSDNEGTVASYNPQKGFGFIEHGTPPNSLFFHRSVLLEEDSRLLVRGDKVHFRLGRNHKGTCAVRVRKVKKEKS